MQLPSIHSRGVITGQPPPGTSHGGAFEGSLSHAEIFEVENSQERAWYPKIST